VATEKVGLYARLRWGMALRRQAAYHDRAWLGMHGSVSLYSALWFRMGGEHKVAARFKHDQAQAERAGIDVRPGLYRLHRHLDRQRLGDPKVFAKQRRAERLSQWVLGASIVVGSHAAHEIADEVRDQRAASAESREVSSPAAAMSGLVKLDDLGKYALAGSVIAGASAAAVRRQKDAKRYLGKFNSALSVHALPLVLETDDPEEPFIDPTRVTEVHVTNHTNEAMRNVYVVIKEQQLTSTSEYTKFYVGDVEPGEHAGTIDHEMVGRPGNNPIISPIDDARSLMQPYAMVIAAGYTDEKGVDIVAYQQGSGLSPGVRQSGPSLGLGD
jgi:hypothetical protein